MPPLNTWTTPAPALGKRRADGDVLTDRRHAEPKPLEAVINGFSSVVGRSVWSGGVDDENAADIGGPVDVAARDADVDAVSARQGGAEVIVGGAVEVVEFAVLLRLMMLNR